MRYFGSRVLGLFCDRNLIPHFPPAELALLGRGSASPARGDFRMYLSLLMKGRQPNDCDATSSHTGSVEAATKGLSKSGDYFSATRAAVSKEQLCQLVRIFSLRSELSRFAAISRMGRAIGAIPTRRWEPAEAEKGQADAHSVLGMAGCRLMLKFRRRKRVAAWGRSARAPAAVRVMTPRARICLPDSASRSRTSGSGGLISPSSQ